VLSVRVHARAKHNAVTGVANGCLLVRTTAAPADGKANKAVVKLIADHLGMPPSRINLSHGATSRDKVFVVRNGAVEL
jgi:uncharacterized protein YggU (UPF0235/DUF167 family)